MTPNLTALMIFIFDSWKILSSDASQKNVMLGLMRSWNGYMIGLSEYAEETWFTNRNHERAPVMLVGVGKLRIADVMC